MRFESRKIAGYSLFLAETDAWLAKYEPGTFRRKRVEMFTSMSGAKIL